MKAQLSEGDDLFEWIKLQAAKGAYSAQVNIKKKQSWYRYRVRAVEPIEFKELKITFIRFLWFLQISSRRALQVNQMNLRFWIFFGKSAMIEPPTNGTCLRGYVRFSGPAMYGRCRHRQSFYSCKKKNNNINDLSPSYFGLKLHKNDRALRWFLRMVTTY